LAQIVNTVAPSVKPPASAHGRIRRRVRPAGSVGIGGGRRPPPFL